jgi:hypothetical protein
VEPEGSAARSTDRPAALQPLIIAFASKPSATPALGRAAVRGQPDVNHARSHPGLSTMAREPGVPLAGINGVPSAAEERVGGTGNLLTTEVDFQMMVRNSARRVLVGAISGFATIPTVATAGEGPVPEGRLSRSIPAEGDREWNCANWSPDEWVVSTAGGQLAISRRDQKKPPVSFPFDPLPKPGETKEDLAGPSVVRAAFHGYLVGYDEGEFGGGTWPC